MQLGRALVDTLETKVRKTILIVILLLITASMLYHLCYRILPNLFPGDWSLRVFAYAVSTETSDLPRALLDVTIRDIIPISLILSSILLAPIWIVKNYRLSPLRAYSKEVADLVNRLAVSNKVGINRSYVMKSTKATSFIFGIRRANLVLTSATIDLLTENEIEAVIAHELSHVLNKDMTVATWSQFYSMAILCFFPVILIYEIAQSLLLNGLLWMLVTRLVFILVLLLFFPLALIRSFCRAREVLADAKASTILGSSERLESALFVMKTHNQMQNQEKQKVKQSSGPTFLSILPPKEITGYLKGKLFDLISHHPSVISRAYSLHQGEYIGVRKKAPKIETSVWIGAAVAMLYCSVNEVVSSMTGAFIEPELWRAFHDDWWSMINNIWHNLSLVLIPMLLSIYFAIFLRSYIRVSPIPSKNQKISFDNFFGIFYSYLRNAWKSLFCCFLALFVVFLPWGGYLGFWGFTFLIGGSIQTVAGGWMQFNGPPPFFHYNLDGMIVYSAIVWPLTTILFILLLAAILGGVTEEMQKVVEKHSKIISRSFVEAEVPKEYPFFDKIWDALSRTSASKGEPEEVKAKVSAFIDPSLVNTLVTPFVIAVVSAILSNFLTDIIKERIKRRRTIEDEVKREIHMEVTRIASRFGISKDLAVKIELYTIEYVESH